MKALPNAAEIGLAETVRRIGRKGFETALHDWLRRAVMIDNLLVLAYSDRGRPQVLFCQADLPQVFGQLDTTYLAGAYLLDPFYELHRTRAPAGVYRLMDVAPDAFPRSRYFRDYYRQTTLIDELTFVVWLRTGLSLNICLGRDAGSGHPFEPRAVETCARIAPIVAALAEAHWADLSADDGPATDLVQGLVSAAFSVHALRLTQRQAAVALLVLRGHSTPSIASRLGVSPQTVKVFRKQLYQRCRISSQAELFALMLPLLKREA